VPDLATQVFREIAWVTAGVGALSGVIAAVDSGRISPSTPVTKYPRTAVFAKRVAEIVGSSRLPASRRQPREEDLTAIPFWGALTETEQRAFASVAQECTFSRGTRMMEEGEHSSQVMVIRHGWTKICVRENGPGQAERTIAMRGPGQLVGERAAMERTVRSASVIADETVRSLVLTPEDFTAFLNAHPAVRGIVEDQVYRRARHPDRPQLNGQNCTIVHTDIVGFSQDIRNDDHRRAIRHSNLSMTMKAIDSIWDSCYFEDRGDGILLVVRPDIPTSKVLECLLTSLPAALKQHNDTYAEALQIQLRIAVDVGPVVTDTIGISGDAIIRTSRLLEAAELKAAMTNRRATLGVIVSTFVYDAAVPHSTGTPVHYVPVQADVKESSIPARMLIIE
jgi:Cyclic nucleotide-binding domain